MKTELVGGIPTPLKKKHEVNWDDYSQHMEKHLPNHQQYLGCRWLWQTLVAKVLKQSSTATNK